MAELSRRERDVAALVAEGLSNRAIASRLYISERTAEYHVEQIRNKLGVHSRTDVAAWVRERDEAAGGRLLAGSLPTQLTSFIGRSADLVELQRLLKEERLITLTGPGGVGKTRLAVKLAASLPWPDGAWFVDLAGMVDGDLVWDAIAQGLRVAERPRQTLAESVTGHLAPRSSLLLLDNCEHQLTAVAPAVADVLSGCPNVRVLATSRAPLGVPGEMTWPVQPLPVPDFVHADIKQVEATDSVRLFIARARLARPAFVLEPGNAEAVAEITRRLDGIPLAIELAAARVRSMGPAEILDRLHDRFRLLAGGARTSMPRQQTMWATLDWTYAQLSREEQTIFNRLGVFAGGFDLMAAEQVCADPLLPPERVWDLVSRLVEKSMVQLEKGVGGSRYRLLDTMRAFALQQAGEGTGLRELRARHAAIFLARAEEAESLLVGPRQAEWLDRLEADMDNLRAALEWYLAEEPESSLRLGFTMRWFWYRRRHLSEGRELVMRALSASTEPTVMRGRLLEAATFLEQRDTSEDVLESWGLMRGGRWYPR